jgi:EmrB/QacA subfamily drug resistance transporter
VAAPVVEKSPSTVKTNNRRAITICLATSMLLASLGSSVANAALPTLVQSFDTNFQSAQWIVLAYLLAATTLVVSAGRLADIAGQRRLLLIGIASWTTASLLCASAPSLGVLIAARAVQGGAAAIIMAVSLAMVGKQGAGVKVGAAMGVVGAMSAVGTALGPSLGGLVTALVGWRGIFLVVAPVGIAAFILSQRYLPRDDIEATRAGIGFDFPGTLVLGTGLASYSLAMTVSRGAFTFAGAGLALAALAALIAFVSMQARAADPLVPITFFRSESLRAGLLTSLIVSTVLMSTLVVGPFYLVGALKLDTSQTGMILTIGPGVVALLSYPSGKLADRNGPSKASLLGLLVIGTGCAILAILPAAGVPGYVAPLLLIAAGYSIFQTANNTAVMSRAQDDRPGVISGLLNLSRNLGLITGASLMGAVFSAGTGSSAPALASPEQVGQGFRTTFLVAAMLIGVAVWISVRPRPSESLGGTASAPASRRTT